MQKFYPFHQGCLSLTLTLSGGERLTSGFIWLLLDPSSGLTCKVPCSDCNTPPHPDPSQGPALLLACLLHCPHHLLQPRWIGTGMLPC